MLDKLDRELIKELQDDGMQGNVALAKKLGVSEGTIRRRIANLLRSGVIRIRAIPDPGKLGCEFICVMGLTIERGNPAQIAKILAQSPNVYLLCYVTGRFDLILILVLHNTKELADFVDMYVAPKSSNIRSETFVVIDFTRSPWADGLNLAELLQS